PTHLSTLSLHDALPISTWLGRPPSSPSGSSPGRSTSSGRSADGPGASLRDRTVRLRAAASARARQPRAHLPHHGDGALGGGPPPDRKSTRLNSSHDQIS